MPAVSLVVCIKDEREFLDRMIRNTVACRDDLVVVHVIPDRSGVRELVESARGRFFERPAAGSQEPDWPFAWEHASHDWILRLDADEYPSDEMKLWLREFRSGLEPPKDVSGYTCHWPMWDGKRRITRQWPSGRPFLFHRRRVRFFGMPEQGPVADGRWEALDLALRHEPNRKSHGPPWGILSSEGRRLQRIIGRGLLGEPTDFPSWRWERNQPWPEHWENVRERPLRTAVYWLTRGTLSTLRAQWRTEKRIFPLVALTSSLWQVFLCVGYLQARRKHRRHGGSNGGSPGTH